MTVPAGTFWTPDVIFLDVVETKYSSYSHQMIHAAGLVIPITTTASITLMCQMKVKYFPFDTQASYKKCNYTTQVL